jgi:hypothetical protein
MEAGFQVIMYGRFWVFTEAVRMPLPADYPLPDHEWVAEGEAEISPAISGRTGFENKQARAPGYRVAAFPSHCQPSTSMPRPAA